MTFDEVKNFVPSDAEIASLFRMAQKTVSRLRADGFFKKGDPLFKVCSGINACFSGSGRTKSPSSASEKLKIAQYYRTIEQTEIGRQKIREMVLADVKKGLSMFFGGLKNTIIEVCDSEEKRQKIISALDGALKDTENFFTSLEESRPSLIEEIENEKRN